MRGVVWEKHNAAEPRRGPRFAAWLEPMPN
jgi:hypothetical protein